MFNKTTEELNIGEAETIIGPSVKVEGDFKGEGNVVVEGEVVGTLKTNQNVRIGAGAKVKANVEAANILIAGQVTGNLNIKEKTELKSTARVNGDIFTKIICIETGGVLNGNCSSGGAQEDLTEVKNDQSGLKLKTKNNPKKTEGWKF